MSHDAPIPDAIPFRTLSPISGAARLGLAVLVLIGIAAAALAFLTGHYVRFWDALLFNWLFWSSLAMGMVMFAVALHITEADWAWSIRRLAVGGAAFLPISFLLLLPVFFGSEHYFHHWLPVVRGEVADQIIENKSAWLNLPFLIVRNIVGVAILYGLAIWFAYLSLRPDVHGAFANRHRPIYDRMTQGWRGVGEEVQRSRTLMTRLAPVLALAFAIIWGLVGIDLAMTLEPHWFSTMFPVAFFVTAFHGGIAATAIATTVLRSRLGLQEYITTRQYHDLGKLVFAFSIFWMYINWSQYFVIWYGMFPHEQEWFVHRFVDPFGPFVRVIVTLVFILPFFGLLTRPPKKVPAVLAFFSVLILIGHWLERFMLIVPSLWEGEGFPLGLTEIGMGLGFMGLFLSSYIWFARSFPLLPSPATLAARGSAVVQVPVTPGRPIGH
ncbi:hypothetical protein BH23GEM3_BH23GEM3_27010 [soil metagenome]